MTVIFLILLLYSLISLRLGNSFVFRYYISSTDSQCPFFPFDHFSFLAVEQKCTCEWVVRAQGSLNRKSQWPKKGKNSVLNNSRLLQGLKLTFLEIFSSLLSWQVPKSLMGSYVWKKLSKCIDFDFRETVQLP